MLSRALTLSFLVSVAVVAACDEDAPDGASPSPDAGVTPAGACPATTTGPTVHRGEILADEVWTAATGPHVVEGEVAIHEGAKLTIEPCADVQLAAGARILVAEPLTPNQGTLVAEGTETQPITFKARDGSPWGSIHVHAPGTARLAYVTLEGGGDGAFDQGASLVGLAQDFGDAVLSVDHVTVRKSRGAGVSLQGGATFIAGSKELVVTGSGDEENPYPLVVSEQAFDALPTGTYTGNRVDEILIDPVGNGWAAGGMIKDATLHDRGVPYHVGNSPVDELIVGGGPKGTLTTLTIEPGVVLKFEPQSMLAIQEITADEPSTGAIRALGTAEKPIVLTSAAASPKPGDWRGLWFGGIPQATNELEHVRIEYAGYDCHCSLNTCSAISEFEAAVILTAQPPSGFITDSTFAHIAGHGVVQGFDGTLVDFRSTNTFDDVSGCAQTRPRNPDTSCPAPRPACDQ